MNEDERSIDHLEVMLEYARRGLSFVEGMDFAGFRADLRTQSAVAMALVMIGEMASRIIKRNAKLVARHPEMPWSQITGMRNRIAHEYDKIDIAVMWSVVHESLPALARQIPLVLKPLLDRYDPPKPLQLPES